VGLPAVAQCDKKLKGLTLASIVVLGLNVAGIVLLPVVVLATRRMFLRIFEEAGMPLPSLTRAFFSVPIFLWFLLCFAIAAALIVKETLVSNKKINLIINSVAAVFACIFILIYGLALAIPLIQVITELE